MPTVRILNGPNQNQTFVLRGGELVGRDPSNTIQVFAPGVSRRHFQFKSEGGQFFVEDLGSSNGTYVNNQRIGKHLLRDSDTITVGGINIRYSINDLVPGAAGLASSSEEIQIGVFGQQAPPGFGASPVPQAGGQLPATAQVGQSVVIQEDDEEGATDYSLDASIVFSPQATVPSEDQIAGLQKRLAIMFDIAQALGDIQTQEKMCEKVMDELFQVFPQADRGFVLLGKTVEQLEPVVVRHRNEEATEVQISRTIARKVLTDKQAILSQNAMEDDRFSGVVSIINLRILSIAAAPLLYRDEVFGLVQIDTQGTGKKFTPDDLNLMAGIAAQAATFLKNHALTEARQNLERYFSPALADQVASGQIDLKLGGDMKSGTVFFSDIIGFTSMSERMTPADVVAKINRYMRVMVDIVFKRQGTVDKFIGDCIMAVWGVPLALPNDASLAVTAAVEMQNALFLLNCEFKAENNPPLHMGIGLNSGHFVAGNMGSEKRMEYTVIGDSVNLAQRLESKAGRGMVLVSETTWENSQDHALACKLKPTHVKGKANPISVYSIRGVTQPSNTGIVYMTSLPLAVDAWAEDCKRALLVKVKLAEGQDQVLGLVLFEERPEGQTVTLQCYASELPTFSFELHLQGEVPIQAEQGCCMKGLFSIKDTPLESLFRDRVYESEKGPDDMPRAQSPA